MRDISVRCIYTFTQHISGSGINFLVGINAVSNWYVFGMFVSATTTIMHNIHVYSAYEYDFPSVVEFFFKSVLIHVLHIIISLQRGI